MSDEREWTGRSVFHEEVDTSEEADAAITDANQLKGEGKFTQALERLAAVEKKARLGNDTKSSLKIVRVTVAILLESKDWDLLMSSLTEISKKRSQMKQVSSTMVKLAMDALDSTPDEETKVKLIQTLRDITDGQIHMELYFVRLTRMLSDIWESRGETESANDLMKAVNVETVGDMDMEEKVSFILEQIRLCLHQKDYTMALIISKKIPHRTMAKHKVPGHKIQFYRLLQQYYEHESQHYEVAFCLLKIVEVIFADSFLAKKDEKSEKDEKEKDEKEEKKEEEPEKKDPTAEEYRETPQRMEVFRQFLNYLILSPASSKLDIDEFHQGSVKAPTHRELLDRFKDDKKLEELPMLSKLVSMLRETELIWWADFSKGFQPLREQPELQSDERWACLKERLSEHNIRTIAQFYSRIHLERLSELVGTPLDELEPFLCDMITTKQIKAKIDRVTGEVNFQQAKDVAATMNEWRTGINTTLSLLDSTCHLISKEWMVARAAGNVR